VNQQVISTRSFPPMQALPPVRMKSGTPFGQPWLPWPAWKVSAQHGTVRVAFTQRFEVDRFLTAISLQQLEPADAVKQFIGIPVGQRRNPEQHVAQHLDVEAGQGAPLLQGGTDRLGAVLAQVAVGLQLGANYRLGERWSIGVTATSAQLQGDAKKSPITVDKTQNSIGVFAAYHF